jgi:hypothetical protein
LKLIVWRGGSAANSAIAKKKRAQKQQWCLHVMADKYQHLAGESRPFRTKRALFDQSKNAKQCTTAGERFLPFFPILYAYGIRPTN